MKTKSNEPPFPDELLIQVIAINSAAVIAQEQGNNVKALDYTNATKNWGHHPQFCQKKLAGYAVLCTKLLLDMNTAT
jgi:hypothetical protein